MSDKTLGAYQRHEKHDTDVARPVTVTDEMVKRGVNVYLRGGETIEGVVRAVLTTALTPEPKRPDGAEEIEKALRDIDPEAGGECGMWDGFSLPLIADALASRGVRVVGEEDR